MGPRGRIGRHVRAVQVFGPARVMSSPRGCTQYAYALLEPWPRSGPPPVSSAPMHMQILDAVRRAVPAPCEHPPQTLIARINSNAKAILAVLSGTNTSRRACFRFDEEMRSYARGMRSVVCHPLQPFVGPFVFSKGCGLHPLVRIVCPSGTIGATEVRGNTAPSAVKRGHKGLRPLCPQP